MIASNGNEHNLAISNKIGFVFLEWSGFFRDIPVGEGTVIKAGSIIDPGVRIAANVYIGAKTSIAHEATFEDGASMSAGADVGKCLIGKAVPFYSA